jgi:branched-chain amino acid transport system permease protein
VEILEEIAFQAINGLVWGLIIALIALGLTLVFGLLEIINVAHGALYMMGAIIAWYIVHYLGSFWLALAAAPVGVGLVGMLIERSILRPVEKEHVLTIIVTFGLMLILNNLALAIFGGAPQRMMAPFEINLSFLGFGYPGYRVFVALFSVVVLGGLWTFLYKSKYGLWMRAVHQDREMALAIGIPVKRVFMLTFGLGAFMAALGGVLAGPIVPVDFNMGLDILVITFIVVIVGGLGSLEGSVLAALLISEMEGISTVFVEPVIARVFSLTFMAGVLLLRPSGLLGWRK